EAPDLTRSVGSFHAVLGGGHVADLPPAIHLVSEAPVLDVVRRLETVLAPEVAPASSFLYIAVFDERRRALGCTGSKIHRQERIDAGEPAPADELVRPELVRFDRVPCPFEDLGSFLLRPDAVQPAVAGNEIAAGIAHDRDTERMDLFEYIFAKAVGV